MGNEHLVMLETKPTEFRTQTLKPKALGSNLPKFQVYHMCEL